jgi:hypothetical protein
MKHITIQITVPEDKFIAFKEVAKQYFAHEEERDAVSMLLSMFIEYMGRDDQWTLFIPGLSNSCRSKWQQVADALAEKMREIDASVLPESMLVFRQAIEDNGGLDASDAVAVLVMQSEYGEVKLNSKPVGAMASRGAQDFIASASS